MTRKTCNRPAHMAKLLAGCSMALACSAQLAHAQSFQANSTVVDGAALVTTAAGVTDIEVRTPETVINWTPTDVNGTGVIDFQPINTTANFFSFADPNFTVLNRIIPVDGAGAPTARAIAFNGTVNSFFPTNAGNIQSGNVWFYSPTGIIVGSSGAFNVGGLVLTTNDIVFGTGNTGGSTLFGPTGNIAFRGPVGSTGFVQIDPGAQINAQSGFAGSYVALVAPRVVQSGFVSADGGIAYVAGEEVNLTINAGLFDITILTGTTDPNGIVHTGTTTGPASAGALDPQVISVVALPKNAAMTMLLSGSIGYTPAAVAANDGSAVVLSAGYGFFDASGQPLSESPDNFGNIEIRNATFSNLVTGSASNRIDVAPLAGSADFLGDVGFFAQQGIGFDVGSEESVTVGGDLFLFSAESGTGGSIDLGVLSGTFDIAGFLVADASSDASLFFPNTPTDGNGGTISLTVEGTAGLPANFSALGAILQANGIGANDSQPLFNDGGNGFGGAITISAGPFSTLNLTSLTANADGAGGSSSLGTGGDGFGGDIALLDLGGALNLGDVGLGTSGFGGFGGLVGGNGTGGRTVIDISSQAQQWNSLFVNAGGVGAFPAGAGAAGGMAFGDPNAITLSVAGPGSLDVLGPISLNADASAGYDAGPGSFSTAGGILIDVSGGAVLSSSADIYAHANAYVAADPPLPAITDAPDLNGGNVAIAIDSGTISALSMLVEAEATAISGRNTSGTGTGGTASVSLANGGNLTLAGAAAGFQLEISADALGVSGVTLATARGGTASLVSDSSQVNIAGATLVTASILPDPDYNPAIAQAFGFEGIGGTALVDLSNSAFSLGPVGIGAFGAGDLGTTPGTGTGGSASFVVDDTLTGTASRTIDLLALNASGLGGGTTVAGSTNLTVRVLDPAASVSINGDLTATAQGAVAPAGAGFTAQIAGVPFAILGNAVIDTSRDATMTVATPGVFDVAGTLDIAARSVTTTGEIVAGGNVTVVAPLGISMTDLQSGGTTLLQATAGPVAVSNDLSSAGAVTALGTSLNIRALSSLTVADAQASAGDIVLAVDGAASDLVVNQATASGAIVGSAADGAIATTGPVSGSAVTLTASNTIDANGPIVASTGNVQLSAGTTYSGTSNIDAAGDILLAAGTTAIQSGPVDAGNSIAVTSGGDLTLIGNFTATNTADFTSGGLLTVDAAVTGTGINASSNDIAILPDAQLGLRGVTQDVTLQNNTAAGGTFIGGDVAGSYSLNQAEIDAIAADASLTILGSSAGLMTIGDVTVSTGPTTTLGTGGTLSLVSGGDMFVAGDLLLQGADAATTLSLTGQQVLVSADTGSVIVADGNGLLAGNLLIDGTSLIVASDAALSDLGSGTTDVTVASDRLGIADGAANDGGYLQADTIDISVVESVYIQNSGTSEEFVDRRGFTANALNIDTASAATQIVINGVILSAGEPVTGLDTIPLLTINGAQAAGGGQFNPLSTVNGCIIGLSCRLEFVPLDQQSEDQLKGVTPKQEAPNGESLVGGSTIIEIRESEPLVTPPLVDEPITGVGNDDLWLRECSPDDDDDSCPIEENEQ